MEKFTPMKSGGFRPSRVTVIRTLAVFVLMQHRTKRLLLTDFTADQTERSQLISLVGSCRQAIQDSCEHWKLDHGSMMDLIREASELSIFNFIFERVYGYRLALLEESQDENSFMGLVLDGLMVI